MRDLVSTISSTVNLPGMFLSPGEHTYKNEIRQVRPHLSPVLICVGSEEYLELRGESRAEKV